MLTGENGAGKTNLLEAVSFLSPGRGLRRAAYAEIARSGAADGFAVHARVTDGDGDTEIGTGTAGGAGGAPEAGRRIRINGANARSAEDMLEILRVTWMIPAMDALFGGPAGDRRRFLDRLVLAIDPNHGQRTLDYEKAMRGRNRLLAEDLRDGAWFDAIEAQMAETGVAIAAARGELVRLLTAMIAKLPDDGPFPARRDHARRRRSNGRSPNARRSRSRRLLRAALASGRPRDRAAGRTLDGPHRADLLVRHSVKGHAGRTLLDRRAEGPADRADHFACAADRGNRGLGADPAARRGGGASRLRAGGRRCLRSSTTSTARLS